MQRVIGDPKHPYSQLLVSSIPLPNLSKPWGGEEVHNAEPLGSIPGCGCLFAPRCPHATEICSKERPAKFVLDRHRLAACFLYRDAPVLEEPNIATVFRPLEHALAAKHV